MAASDSRADCAQDRRFYALVLLATFASLRWGEVTALHRADLDLEAPYRPDPGRLRGALNW